MYCLGHGCSLSVSQGNQKSFIVFIDHWDIGFCIAWNWQYPGRLGLCSDFEEKLE